MVPRVELVATRLTVAFGVWAAVVAGAAGLVVHELNTIATTVGSFQDKFTTYVVAMEKRVTQLEEHDKLSDDERKRNTAAIAELDRKLDQELRDMADHKARSSR